MTTSSHSDLALLRFEELLGVDGKHYSLVSLAGRRATLVVFTGNGCPTARAYEDRLKTMQGNWGERGLQIVAINSNNPHLSPPDTFAEMVTRAALRGFNYPYLKDDDSSVAAAYGAICTPHAFLLNAGLDIAYIGRIDDSRLGDNIQSRDLEEALAALLEGREVNVAHTEPFGCGIVW